MKNKKKTFLLDYKTWRSGNDIKHATGKGETQLLNSEGYMCCLGQWCQQRGAPSYLLLDTAEPKDIELERIFRRLPAALKDENFVAQAIIINDSVSTPGERMMALTMLCHMYGYKLLIKNVPEDFVYENSNW